MGKYSVVESADLVYLQANGSRPVGDSVEQTIEIPNSAVLENDPILFGQVHNPVIGQVLVSINGAPDIVVHPYEYEDGCNSSGWKSFRQPLMADMLRVGSNTLVWSVGPRPACLESWEWDGFSIKGLEIQYESVTNGGGGGAIRKVPVQGLALIIAFLALTYTGLRRIHVLTRTRF